MALEQLRAQVKREALELLQIAANLALKIQKAEMQKRSGRHRKRIYKNRKK